MTQNNFEEKETSTGSINQAGLPPHAKEQLITIIDRIAAGKKGAVEELEELKIFIDLSQPIQPNGDTALDYAININCVNAIDYLVYKPNNSHDIKHMSFILHKLLCSLPTPWQRRPKNTLLLNETACHIFCKIIVYLENHGAISCQLITQINSIPGCLIRDFPANSIVDILGYLPYLWNLMQLNLSNNMSDQARLIEIIIGLLQMNQLQSPIAPEELVKIYHYFIQSSLWVQKTLLPAMQQSIIDNPDDKRLIESETSLYEKIYNISSRFYSYLPTKEKKPLLEAQLQVFLTPIMPGFFPSLSPSPTEQILQLAKELFENPSEPSLLKRMLTLFSKQKPRMGDNYIDFVEKFIEYARAVSPIECYFPKGIVDLVTEYIGKDDASSEASLLTK